MWVVHGGLGPWDPKFLRPFSDWEMDVVQVFIVLTSNSAIAPLGKDKLIRKGDVFGCFMVKAYFNHLEGVSLFSIPTTMLWNPYVPSKIDFFAWEAWWGKVLIASQLKRRGLHLASKYPFCGKKEEEPEHILIHCPSIWDQWTDLLSAFGVYWVSPYLVKDLLHNWLHFPARKKAKAIWRIAPLILFWVIWRERNRIIFEDATFSTLKLKISFIQSLYTWAGCIPNADIFYLRILLFRYYDYA